MISRSSDFTGDVAELVSFFGSSPLMSGHAKLIAGLVNWSKPYRFAAGVPLWPMFDPGDVAVFVDASALMFAASPREVEL